MTAYVDGPRATPCSTFSCTHAPTPPLAADCAGTRPVRVTSSFLPSGGGGAAHASGADARRHGETRANGGSVARWTCTPSEHVRALSHSRWRSPRRIWTSLPSSQKERMPERKRKHTARVQSRSATPLATLRPSAGARAPRGVSGVNRRGARRHTHAHAPGWRWPRPVPPRRKKRAILDSSFCGRLVSAVFSERTFLLFDLTDMAAYACDAHQRTDLPAQGFSPASSARPSTAKRRAPRGKMLPAGRHVAVVRDAPPTPAPSAHPTRPRPAAARRPCVQDAGMWGMRQL